MEVESDTWNNTEQPGSYFPNIFMRKDFGDVLLSSLILLILSSCALVLIAWFSGLLYKHLCKTAREFVLSCMRVSFKNRIDKGKVTPLSVPRHVAFIMDGNRRWARKRKLEVTEGHKMGYNALKSLLELCEAFGVKTVSVYAFSIENFKRSAQEVSTLMELAAEKFEEMLFRGDVVQKHDVRVRVLGAVHMLPEKLQVRLARAVSETKHRSTVTLNICFPYTSTEEIGRAKKLYEEYASNCATKPSDIEAASMVDKLLYTREDSRVDLLLRTSGEVRFSDFMTWQCGFAQLQFVEALWPDFGFVEMMKSLYRYNRFVKSGSRLESDLLPLEELPSSCQDYIRKVWEEEDKWFDRMGELYVPSSSLPGGKSVDIP
mmetsp:Transcript_45111/g.116674  ORF Transcript_45111/g.116674 Transcript_45111/m.116674 type:complete len:374 (-) Transcript_45111:112-1233(-)